MEQDQINQLIDKVQIFAIPLIFIGYILWSTMRFAKVKKLIPDLLKKGAQIIDVRTKEEFKSVANPNSLNIPLDQISKNLNKINRNKPVILVCRSGNRSGMAARILKQNGFTDVVNAGPWTNTLLD